MLERMQFLHPHLEDGAAPALTDTEWFEVV